MHRLGMRYVGDIVHRGEPFVLYGLDRTVDPAPGQPSLPSSTLT